MKIKINEKIQQSLVIGICLIISAYVFGIFFYSAKNTGNTIKVTGYAVKRISSDLVKWSIVLSKKNIPGSDMQKGYALIKRDVDFVTARLAAGGIKPEEITIHPTGVEQQYGKNSQLIDVYNINQELLVTSGGIAGVESLAMKPEALLDKGMVLQSSNLQYLVTNLSPVKKEMIAEATNDGMQRAQEISKKTSIQIGKLIEARIGVFQINAPNSPEASDFGNYSTTTKDKDISVTVELSFVLK